MKLYSQGEFVSFFLQTRCCAPSTGFGSPFHNYHRRLYNSDIQVQQDTLNRNLATFSESIQGFVTIVTNSKCYTFLDLHLELRSRKFNL